MKAIFLIFVPLFICIWIVLIHFDKERIRQYLEQRGGKIVSIKLRLFGHGWLSENSKEGGGNRIYEIEYSDEYGNIKHAWSKTAMMAGVFFTEESIISRAKVEGRLMTAEEKVVWLEEELRKSRASR